MPIEQSLITKIRSEFEAGPNQFPVSLRGLEKVLGEKMLRSDQTDIDFTGKVGVERGAACAGADWGVRIDLFSELHLVTFTRTVKVNLPVGNDPRILDTRITRPGSIVAQLKAPPESTQSFLTRLQLDDVGLLDALVADTVPPATFPLIDDSLREQSLQEAKTDADRDKWAQAMEQANLVAIHGLVIVE